jgi:hypothetical protein
MSEQRVFNPGAAEQRFRLVDYLRHIGSMPEPEKVLPGGKVVRKTGIIYCEPQNLVIVGAVCEARHCPACREWHRPKFQFVEFADYPSKLETEPTKEEHDEIVKAFDDCGLVMGYTFDRMRRYELAHETLGRKIVRVWYERVWFKVRRGLKNLFYKIFVP